MTLQPTIYSPQQHRISQQNISKNALKVLEQLHHAGFRACLVGGAVRDLLLGEQPKDFDVATDAKPEQIKRLFRNCRLVGKRFRLAHIIFGRDIIEVATFRAQADNALELHDEDDDIDTINIPASQFSSRTTRLQVTSHTGLLLRDNVYGNITEDALRRDFTVNALYYDIADHTVIDYCGGMQDLAIKKLCLIGEPNVRYREDPVRMIRAIRFATKLGFELASNDAKSIPHLAHLLQSVSPARLFDEVIKLFMSGHGLQIFHQLRDYKLFGQIFPYTERALLELNNPETHLLSVVLDSTDARVQKGLSTNPYFLYAALLWEPYLDEFQACLEDHKTPLQASIDAARIVLRRQQSHTMIPKRIAILIEELWLFQIKLTRKNTKTVSKLLENTRFRAAFDFLELRAHAFESDTIIDALKWWQHVLQQPEYAHQIPLSSEKRKQLKHRHDKRISSS